MWGLGRAGESVPRPRPCGVGPRANRRIGTSFEASRCGSGPSPLRVSPDICSRWAGRSSRASDVAGLPTVVPWLQYFTRSKRFFRFLLRGPLFLVPDNWQSWDFKFRNFFSSTFIIPFIFEENPDSTLMLARHSNMLSFSSLLRV